MLSGIYQNPTTIFFGKEGEQYLGPEVSKHSQKILLLYGNRSFKEHGFHEKIITSLKENNVSYVEVEGVEPNPQAELIYQAIKICKKENIDFILAVGGGSVIDSAKAISIGVPYEGDFCDFFENKAIPKQALKIATVLTIPGSGSESNEGAVISFGEKQRKLSFSHQLMFPLFSILNPEMTFSLSNFYTSCGVVDAISHLFERYFSNTEYVDCTDRLGESLIQTLMKYAPLVLNEPTNYDYRAEIMWACKLAHDNTAGFGRKHDWATHFIAHEFGAKYNIAHGAALSILFPAWMEYVYPKSPDKFYQLFTRIFNIQAETKEETILQGIYKFKSFLKTINMPCTFSELNLDIQNDLDEISKKSVRTMPSGTIGNFIRLSPTDIINILQIQSVR